MFIEAVVAMDKLGYISKDQGLPWEGIEEERRLHQQLTKNSALVLGSNTAKTINPDYPKGTRDIVCITRDPAKLRSEDGYDAVDYFVSNLEDVDKVSKKNKIVLGGGDEVFKNFLQFADVLHATVVLDEFDGDKKFCQYVAPYRLETTDKIKTLEGNPNIVYNKYVKDPKGDVITLY